MDTRTSFGDIYDLTLVQMEYSSILLQKETITKQDHQIKRQIY